jgi:DNA-binding protein HU-beta
VTKQEFTATLAERCDLSKADGGRVLDAILGTITDTLADRGEVSFPGFGKFTAQKRRGRDATDPRNPQRMIHIEPGYVPRFKPGTSLRRAIQDAFPADEVSPMPDAGASRQAGGREQPEGSDEGQIGRALTPQGAKEAGNTTRDTSSSWRPLSRR